MQASLVALQENMLATNRGRFEKKKKKISLYTSMSKMPTMQDLDPEPVSS